MALMQLSVVPMGTGSTSISEYVAEFQNELSIHASSFTLTDMGTIIEGDAEELLALAAKIHQLPFQKGVQRVLTQITLDDRRDKKVRLGDKVQSVQDKV